MGFNFFSSKKLSEIVSNIFVPSGGQTKLNLDELEEMLIGFDIGVRSAGEIIEFVKKNADKGSLKDKAKLAYFIKERLLQILEEASIKVRSDEGSDKKIILVSGVNGVGKTTSIAKLANFYKKQNKSVMLAAGDTFRAGAVKQICVWADRLQIPIIYGAEGSDAAAVIHDAVNAARAQNIDILIADTAGRLHTKTNLMQELSKIDKVVEKARGQYSRENLIVLDATLGQNSFLQAEAFNKVAPLDGIILTKLDGTAKGGFVVKIASELKIAPKYVGFGEKIDDFAKFSAEDFANSMF